MTLTITKHNNGYLLQKKIFLMNAEDVADPKYINCMLQLGQDMHYGKDATTLIDYPGEYDIQNIMFTVKAGKGGELNYLITEGRKIYAFIQTEDALNDEDFNADYRLFTNQHIAKMIDKMELEGDKIDLTTIE